MWVFRESDEAGEDCEREIIKDINQTKVTESKAISDLFKIRPVNRLQIRNDCMYF